MSEKEIAMELLEHIPSNKLGFVIAYMQGITADEFDDDKYCEALVDEYEADADRGEYVSFKEMAEMSGVDLNAI